MSDPSSAPTRWFHGITSYQWLVLALASAGWVFDVFEGQIFAITRDDMLKEVLGQTADDGAIRYWGDVFLGVFLIGGMFGGIVFGSLADRYGRRPMLIATILTYSLFSGLTYWADSLWAVGALRFLVAIGVGGEWSVAASLVAEEFPTRARAQASGIFHATSIIGTWLAGLSGLAVGAEWRYAYLLGVVPALLVVSIRWKLREPQAWQAIDVTARGSLPALLRHSVWRKRAFLGLLLAAVGLGTFWGVTIAGQDLTRKMLIDQGVDRAEAQAAGKFAYGIVETAGGGLGLLAFGPFAARWGRRRAFLVFQLGAVIIVPLTCWLPATYGQLLGMLPVYGFFTLGMHAGFAVYFPELFPTSLRATGAGFCFNGGRLIAASILVFSGWFKAQVDLRLAVTLLSLLFVPGMAVVMLLPETKDQPLPE
jgi:MFS family permease